MTIAQQHAAVQIVQIRSRDLGIEGRMAHAQHAILDRRAFFDQRRGLIRLVLLIGAVGIARDLRELSHGVGIPALLGFIASRRVRRRSARSQRHDRKKQEEAHYILTRPVLESRRCLIPFKKSPS